MTPLIRTATAADHDRLLELDLRTWSSVSSPAPVPGPDRAMFARRPPEDHLVAEIEGAIVGFVAIGHPTPLEASRHVIEVQGITVDPDHGGRGVGRTLMEAVVAEARRRGARKITLRVLAHNTVARRLYERAGFTVEGHLVGEFILDGEPVDDLLMARHLD